MGRWVGGGVGVGVGGREGGCIVWVGLLGGSCSSPGCHAALRVCLLALRFVLLLDSAPCAGGAALDLCLAGPPHTFYRHPTHTPYTPHTHTPHTLHTHIPRSPHTPHRATCPTRSTPQAMIFCRTNFDCDNLEKFFNQLGGCGVGGPPWWWAWWWW